MEIAHLSPLWREHIASFLATDTGKTLSAFIQQEYAKKTIYPPYHALFRALEMVPFDTLRVVILGQDPYHGPGQAHGLAFSVPDEITPPPSLKNIFKEIHNDVGITKDMNNGNLEPWAQQGVLLLNSILTVVAQSPASHHNRGWETLTDTLIKTISEQHDHIVFMLWGNYARSKKSLIDTSRHLVLEAPHPSPFSAHSGFFGCKHFSQCNEYLKKYGKEEIQW